MQEWHGQGGAVQRTRVPAFHGVSAALRLGNPRSQLGGAGDRFEWELYILFYPISVYFI